MSSYIGDSDERGGSVGDTPGERHAVGLEIAAGKGHLRGQGNKVCTRLRIVACHRKKQARGNGNL